MKEDVVAQAAHNTQMDDKYTAMLMPCLPSDITEQEKCAILWLSRGMTHSEVAKMIGVTHRTIDNWKAKLRPYVEEMAQARNLFAKERAQLGAMLGIETAIEALKPYWALVNTTLQDAVADPDATPAGSQPSLTIDDISKVVKIAETLTKMQAVIHENEEAKSSTRPTTDFKRATDVLAKLKVVQEVKSEQAG